VAFREYKLGAMFFGFALSFSMMITIFFPSIYITDHGTPNDYGMDKTLTYGRNSGFTYSDPLLKQTHEPVKAILKKDPVTGEPLAAPMTVYIYRPGDPFPSTVVHPRVLTGDIATLSVNQGKIDSANVNDGAVFTISHETYKGKSLPYIENLTALKGWKPEQVMAAVPDSDLSYAAQGRTLFEREGCWWCHTLLPEETQDWQTFGRPPLVGDLNGQSPTTFGSDRKAPDLLHVGSRNSSREWMIMHLFNPRLVQPHSIMPRFDYLWGDKDANGNTIDYAKWRQEYLDYADGKSVYPPEVPMPAKDSEARHLIDYLLDLK
jgi:cytochrome c oxidase cbb3-type subunit II